MSTSIARQSPHEHSQHLPILNEKCNRNSSRTFLDRKKFWHLLIEEYPDYDKYRWFAGTLIDQADFGYFETKGPIALKEFAAWTKMTLDVIHASFPLIMFPNCMCGWKGMPYKRRYYPIYVQSIDELMELIEKHVHFRCDTGIEDYYITDTGLQ